MGGGGGGGGGGHGSGHGGEDVLNPRVFFCTMPEYSGLSNSIRFPGSIDNQRLSYTAKVEEHCSPPFLKPTRTCAAVSSYSETSLNPTMQTPGQMVEQTLSRIHNFMDEACECEPVADYLEGYDRESCGCQGGRSTAARLTFSILYHTPEVGAFTSAFMAPLAIIVANLFTYILPLGVIETRFGLSTSSLVSLFHAGLKAQAPLAGVLTSPTAS